MPSNPSRYCTPDQLERFAIAIKDRTTPEGRILQECLDRKRAETREFMRVIDETERLRAEDLAMYFNHR